MEQVVGKFSVAIPSECKEKRHSMAEKRLSGQRSAVVNAGSNYRTSLSHDGDVLSSKRGF